MANIFLLKKHMVHFKKYFAIVLELLPQGRVQQLFTLQCSQGQPAMSRRSWAASKRTDSVQSSSPARKRLLDIRITIHASDRGQVVQGLDLLRSGVFLGLDTRRRGNCRIRRLEIGRIGNGRHGRSCFQAGKTGSQAVLHLAYKDCLHRRVICRAPKVCKGNNYTAVRPRG